MRYSYLKLGILFDEAMYHYVSHHYTDPKSNDQYSLHQQGEKHAQIFEVYFLALLLMALTIHWLWLSRVF